MNRRHFILSAAAAASVAPLTRAADPARKWRVAVIGNTGRGDYGHSLDSMWLKMPEVEIVGVADANPKGLAAAQKELSLTTGFAEYKVMLTEVKPDLVAICPSHMGDRREMALAAAASGAKGIYMEKPFCHTLADCDDVMAACEKNKVKLALAHRNRYNPGVVAAEKLVKEGAIGRLLEVRGRGKEDTRGGITDMWVLGSHVLNLCVYFAGKPVACSSVILQDGRAVTPADVTPGKDDVGPLAGNAVHARFDTESGVPIYFDSIQNAGDRTVGFGLQLIGTKGLIDLRMDATPIAHLVPGSPFHPVKEPRPWIPISSAGAGVPEPMTDIRLDVMSHVTGARDLIAAIEENRQPLCSAADGRITVEMITAVLASHTRDGARITFPLDSPQNPLSTWK
ncbi:putative dehydrogenase [Prosthecobacter fusiformis]|uniref:Putative dehydrogenase n=1 Tax=Prosthecobacter fusiformis TaxID=48464 RepID=A0A4R7RZK0_9BACT|nr:Gfo/Idh/MocA family oxidoreductase [Prosthecobacter fusiformis]TDU70839.1 putative dehydrogenase [Prosthecobacter fusiformis]